MTSETQEQPMMAQPQREHEWLQQLVGEWTFEGEAAEPGGSPMKSTGTETVRSLGPLWIIAEGRSAMQDGPEGMMILTLGFDPQLGRFVGTWVGSMMANLWVYSGGLDADGRTLTLDTEGPTMTGDGMAKYRETIQLLSDDHRVFRSQVLQPDGNWVQFMETHYRRAR